MTTKTINLLILNDGLPGHHTQSQGLAKLLADKYELKIHNISVAFKQKALRRWCLNRLLSSKNTAISDPARLFRKSFNSNALPEEEIHLIISAGGNTAHANALLAQHFNCENVFIGSLRTLNPTHFSANLTLERTGDPRNIAMSLAPTLIDSKAIANQGAHFLSNLKIGSKKPWMLLLGGDGAGYKYNQQDWIDIAQWANRIAQKYSICWLISTSRRTGARNEKLLQQHIDCDVPYAIWWNHAPEKNLPAMLGASERVFVTADSMSMITEAVASEKIVYILDHGADQAFPKYQAALTNLEETNLCFRCAVNDIDVPNPNNSVRPSIQRLNASLINKLEEKIVCLNI